MRSSSPRNLSAPTKRSRPGVTSSSRAQPVSLSTRRDRAEQERVPQTARPSRMVVSHGAEVLSLREDRRELICSVIGLSVKVGLAVMAGVSLFRLAGAYQARMERQAELAAVLEIEQAQLAKARNRFDELFTVAGEQKLIREQSQWIAPNRLRVVWQSSDPQPDRPVLAMKPSAPETERRGERP